MRFPFVLILAGLPSMLAAQGVLPASVETCRAIEVTLSTSTPRLTVGTRPQFSVVVTNRSGRSARVLDVRDGRRRDLQDAYFELVIVRDGRSVDLPIMISDPGPISNADYLVLNPDERLDVGELSYKRVAERLPAGEYTAFVLFWGDPYETPTSRCRSIEARFVVSD
jgi:hypothetical protein